MHSRGCAHDGRVTILQPTSPSWMSRRAVPRPHRRRRAPTGSPGCGPARAASPRPTSPGSRARRPCSAIAIEKLLGTGFGGNALHRARPRCASRTSRAGRSSVYGMQPSSALFHADGNRDHLATPDGLRERDGVLELCEIKTTNTAWRGIPRHYLRQVWWQQYVLGAERTLVVWEQHDDFVPVARRPRVPVGRPGRQRDPPARRAGRPASGCACGAEPLGAPRTPRPRRGRSSSRRTRAGCRARLEVEQRHQAARRRDRRDRDRRRRARSARSARCPTANAHCRIVQLAAANASTAARVCTKSCQVKVAPGPGPGIRRCRSPASRPGRTRSADRERDRRRPQAQDRGRAMRMPRPATADQRAPDHDQQQRDLEHAAPSACPARPAR